MREVGPGVTDVVLETDSLHPLLGKPRKRGAQDRLKRVVLAVRKSLNLARSGLRLSREDSLKKVRETKVQKCLRKKSVRFVLWDKIGDKNIGRIGLCIY